jgi:hypothetical protein
VRPNPIRIEGEVAYLALNQGLTARLDAVDAPRVGAHHWTARWESRLGRFRVFTRLRYPGRGGTATVTLHRFLLGTPAHRAVRFRNGDGLDFRRANLDDGSVPDRSPPPTPARLAGDTPSLSLDGGD